MENKRMLAPITIQPEFDIEETVYVLMTDDSLQTLEKETGFINWVVRKATVKYYVFRKNIDIFSHTSIVYRVYIDDVQKSESFVAEDIYLNKAQANKECQRLNKNFKELEYQAWVQTYRETAMNNLTSKKESL